MNLGETRRKIDAIDKDILALLRTRMELSLQAGKIKKNVEDAEREAEVMRNVRSLSKSLVSPAFSENLFKEIISESKRLQSLGSTIIGFQGEHGAYSEAALLSFRKDAVPIPCKEFSEVFEMVKAGVLDFGIVPIENSIEGSVTQVNDLLLQSDLKVVGEVVLPIHHCLLSLLETDYREVKSVYSHPQALGQCRQFLERNKLEARPYYDTAGAAMMLSKDRPKATAVIASSLCAGIYNLEILKENIEDAGSNSTRFLVIASEALPGGGDKCTVSFTAQHKAGSLFSVLRVFSEAGINLTRIESRPLPSNLGAFSFLLDFQGSESDPKISAALEEVREHTLDMKFLGCYKGAGK